MMEARAVGLFVDETSPVMREENYRINVLQWVRKDGMGSTVEELASDWSTKNSPVVTGQRTQDMGLDASSWQTLWWESDRFLLMALVLSMK